MCMFMKINLTKLHCCARDVHISVVGVSCRVFCLGNIRNTNIFFKLKGLLRFSVVSVVILIEYLTIGIKDYLT